ncbi:formin-like protein 7 [Dorcoceras hygrometricum]|uniref:Formin-like protein 7 n=1 Tax=Dorcoceras hygrometricum TaxID=472368 RepID=A0A2Z7BNT9_9LAMI|nr:formin-like protein 7 [Dorcoceras hygrometricum]
MKKPDRSEVKLVKVGRSKSGEAAAAATCIGGGGGEALEEKGAAVSSALGSRTPQNPPQVLNTLSLVSMWESRIQYLCDPQWFRDTASRGPTTIVAPESQFRTCPSDHGIQLAVGPQSLWLRNHNSGLAHRIMVRASSNIAP